MYLKKIKNMWGQRKHLLQKREITWQRVLLWIALSIIGLMLFAILAFGILIAIVSIGLPDVHDLDKLSVAQSTTIYDRDGNVLYVKYGEENRQYVTFDQISPNLIDATVAIEDDKYWEHPGFNALGILRAAINNVLHLGAEQGGVHHYPAIY